jgi:hypothetical protein
MYSSVVVAASMNEAIRSVADGTDGLVNEIGNFSGQVLLPDGRLVLEVLASGGTWSTTPG